MTFLHRIFFLLSVIVVNCNCAWGESKFLIEPNIGRLYGYTLYNISGIQDGHKWASELKWPIDSYVAGVNLAANLNDRFNIELGVRKNIDKNTGKMKDSDYSDGYRIIYSESDTSMDMVDLNAMARFELERSQKDAVGIIGGFRYQDFSFEARNLVQTSIIPGYSGSLIGLDGKYDVKYYIPFIGLGYSLRVDEALVVDLAAKLGYVMVRDEDDHVLRYKKSTGDSAGASIGLAGGLTFNLTPAAFMKLNAEYTQISAAGKQTQSWYATTSEAPAGTTIKDIDLKIDSSQTLLTLGLGLRF